MLNKQASYETFPGASRFLFSYSYIFKRILKTSVRDKRELIDLRRY